MVQRHLPDGVISDADAPFTLEEELELFLAMQKAFLDADPSSALPAFQAIAYVASYYWQGDSAQVPNEVTVPGWLIETIATGFLRYADAIETASPLRFGEAFGLEGARQGVEPAIKPDLRHLRDIRIALLVAKDERAGTKIEAALQACAEQTGLSLSHVRRVWGAHREQARRCLQNLAGRKTS